MRRLSVGSSARQNASGANWSYKLALLVGASMAIAAGPAMAQQAAADITGLSEVVVTAQKREQRLQDVPVAVTALSGETLQQKGIADFRDLTQVAPSMTITQSGGITNNSIVLRGIGTFAFSTGVEPSVAVVVDDLAVLQQAQAFSALSDLERIEVLRGPQGTLFGKSAAAGVVNIVTRAPTRTLSGYAMASATTDDQYRVEAALSGPIGERAGFRVNAFNGESDGYVTNLTTGHKLNDDHTWGVRGRFDVDLSDSLTLDLNASYVKDKTNGQVRTYLIVPAGATLFGRPLGQNLAGITPGYGNNLVRQNYEPMQRSRTWVGSARLNWDLGFANLTSITGYQDWRYIATDDVDASETATFGIPQGLTSTGPFHSKLFSEELRLTSAGAGPLEYVLGLYYADGETSRSFERTVGSPLAANWTAENGSRTYAAFAQATYNFSASTHLDAGLRYNHERIDVSFQNRLPTSTPPANNATCLATCSGNDSQGHVSGKVALRQDFTRQVMGYVSYATGYKGQAYDVSSGFTPARAATAVPEETSRAYEAGLKSRFFDNRAQVNVAAFLTNYNGFQTQSAVVLPSGAVQFNLASVGKLRTKGVEIEAAARPTPSLTLSAAAAYTEARITEYAGANCYTAQTAAQGCVGGVQNLAGARLPNSPKFKYTLSANYETPLGDLPVKGFLTADYRHQSEVIYSLAQDPSTVQPGYGVVDLALGVREVSANRYQLTLFVKNLFDKAYAATISAPNGPSGGLQGQFLPRDYRRYFGARLNYNF